MKEGERKKKEEREEKREKKRQTERGQKKEGRNDCGICIHACVSTTSQPSESRDCERGVCVCGMSE